jgi:tetratricopeptide (TPR) repeat protein
MKRFVRQGVLVCVLGFALPLDARETWHEVRSPNFVVVSNASAERANDVAARMEQFRYALSTLLPGSSLVSEVPTQVYAFRDFDSFESFLPQTDDGVTPAAGYFREGPYKNVIALDLSATRTVYERIIFHEYVHLVLSLSGHDFPLWFEEGMAEFYASASLQNHVAELGIVEERHRRVLRESELLPLADVLTSTEDWPLSAEPHESALFYAQSWSLVHYLVAGSGKRGHLLLAEYLGRLSRGDDRLSAFALVFGQSPEAMAQTLSDYVDAGSFPHYAIEYSGADWAQGLQTTTLATADVEHRWGELFLFTGRLREASVCLEEACRLRPDFGAAWETRAIAALMQERDEEALGYFRRAAFETDVSPNGLYLYARTLLRDHSGHWVGSVPAGLAIEAERALTRSLELKPAQSETSRLLAFVYLVRGVRLDEATRLVENALSMTPGRPSLLYLYGQILARRGDYEGAREALAQIRATANEPEMLQAAAELRARLDRAERAP